MQEKLAITVLVITLALFLLVMVLYNLTTKKQEDYNQIVLSQQQYSSRVLPFKRGDILDRNGTYLATSKKVYNLILDPKQIMTKPDKYLEASVTALVDCFGYDRAEITNLIQEKKDKQYIRYEAGRQLPYEQKQAFEEYKKTMADQFKKEGGGKAIKGIWFEDEYKREYPYNSLACNVVGFANGDGLDGNGGIEQFYNSILMGTNGREYGYLNDESNLERVTKFATDGMNIISTIDVNIQKIVEKYIAEWESTTGSKGVGVIVMDPGNGEVLAMASDKKFDLNNPRELGPEYTDEVLLALGRKEAVDDYRRKHKEENNFTPITEEQVSQFYSTEEVLGFGRQVAWNQNWRNFCVSDAYEPGSPAKIFTVAAALEEGVISGEETFNCQGSMEVGGWPIGCVAIRRGGHGLLTAEQGLMVSCNVVMMQIAQRTGKENFYKYEKMFGFGSKTGIDLPAEADTKTLVYDADTTNPASIATNSFGQNFSCTMIQMAAAYCSVINGGSYYEPHVVRQIQNSQGAVVDKKEPRIVRETVSESTSKYINHALWRTVNDKPGGGTGSAAKIEGYDIAGKTGTAEKIPRDKTNYLLSFAGYAPADEPEVFIYVVVDQPNVEDQPHSTFASAMFQSMMSEILPYKSIFPNEDTLPAPDGAKGQLPEEEGISTPKESESGETAASESSAGESENGNQASETQQGEPATDPSGETIPPAGGEDDYSSELPAAVPGSETLPGITAPSGPNPPVSPLDESSSSAP